MLLFSFFNAFWLSLTGPTTAQATEQVAIRQVTIVGNFRTRERIIRREMDLKAGDTLTLQKLDSLLEYDRRKIINTNLFVTVEIKKKELPVDFQSPQGLKALDIEVTVKEQWYILGAPVFELADRNFNEWWYERGRDLSRTIYGVYLLHQNLTGNSDRLRARIEFGFIPRIDVYYSTPYLDKKQKLGMTVGIIRLTNRTLAYRTRADKLVFLNSEERTRERISPYLSFTYRPKFYGFHSLTAQYSFTQLNDTIARLNPNYFLDKRTRQDYLQLSYSHFYDRRDRVQYPLKGYFYGFAVSRMGILPNDDIKQTELAVSAGQFVPLSKKLFFSYSVRAKYSTPALQPFLQTRGLGYGADLVRGYELYVIDGQRFGLFRTNLRYQLLNRTFDLSKFIKIRQFNTFPLAIYPNVYFDMGYVHNAFPALNNSNLANTALRGVGIGLDVVTWYNFVGRINYSINHLGEARPYFSIGREF
ncbi:MAG: BamA/TamA family outer membrane protein [Spirosomaceae bacterium]|jgi:outer membrane protein assembly factor BamA|nr:BamA/TamA family outer membrane protein [Spirosomataceae bacterium]